MNKLSSYVRNIYSIKYSPCLMYTYITILRKHGLLFCFRGGKLWSYKNASVWRPRTYLGEARSCHRYWGGFHQMRLRRFKRRSFHSYLAVFPDPHVFGPSGSEYGSISQRYGSEFVYHQAKIVSKNLIPIVLWLLLDRLVRNSIPAFLMKLLSSIRYMLLLSRYLYYEAR